MALIDSMDFDQLMAFEDSHSISLGSGTGDSDSAAVTPRAKKQAVANEAIKELKRSGKFVLPGLGKLVRVERKARLGRNPLTGEPIKIRAKKVVKFRVAKAVKDAIEPANTK
jgi:DNA-binding protein HU-beta